MTNKENDMKTAKWILTAVLALIASGCATIDPSITVTLTAEVRLMNAAAVEQAARP